MSPRSDEVRIVDERMLRTWPLPEPGRSKHDRGNVVVLGGSAGTPGAVMLAGTAALRVGAGRLTLIVPEASVVPVAVALPEAGVLPFYADDSGTLLPREAMDAVVGADAVLIGPGFTDARTARLAVTETLAAIGSDSGLVIDAFCLGVLGEMRDLDLGDRAVLTPNHEEARILLGEPASRVEAESVDAEPPSIAAIAERFGAAVTSYGDIAARQARAWRVAHGGPGLGTSGSGDVLAGAVAGLLARGADPAQAAVWATWLHATADQSLAARSGVIGYLARELCDELGIALGRAEKPRAPSQGRVQPVRSRT